MLCLVFVALVFLLLRGRSAIDLWCRVEVGGCCFVSTRGLERTTEAGKEEGGAVILGPPDVVLKEDSERKKFFTGRGGRGENGDSQ